MDSDDGIEESESSETPQDINTDVGETRAIRTLRASSGAAYWAELELNYIWSGNGKTFTVETMRFRAADNGRTSGNIKLGLVSAGDTGWDELETRATQDGQWHTFVKSRFVAGNVDHAIIHFNFIYDRAGTGDKNMTTQERVEYVIPKPSINPIRNVNVRRFYVRGAGGIFNGGSVFVRTSISDRDVLAVITSVSGAWEAIVELSADGRHMTLDAYQKMAGSLKQSDYAAGHHIFLAYITAPAANAVLGIGDKFKGFAAPGSKVKVVRSDNQNVQLAAETTVTTNDSWESALNVALPGGPVAVVAIFELEGFPTVVSQPVTYNVLGVPAITGPSANSIQAQTFTLSGTSAMKGATVKVYRDLTNTSVGHSVVTQDNGTWSTEVTVPAGPVSLAAMQTLSGKDSGRSSPRAFKIKPPKPTNIQITYPSPGTVRFSGTGYPGATVDVHIAHNNTPQASGEVRDGRWVVDWSDQPPARHEINIRQKLADGSNWIDSDWSDRLTVSIPVPVPTLTIQVGTDRKPVFSGSGHSWEGQPAAQVEVRREGEQSSAAPIVAVRADNGWTTTATQAWDPGTYRVQAWQLFNELSSEPSTTQSFTIPAPLPTVEVRQDGLTPHFSGICLNGAQVKLGFDGEQGTPHDAIVNGTTWTFTRTESFMPGTYTARVTQTLGGQTSAEATLAFEIVILQPVITAPIDVEVDHNPTIRGSGGMAGAMMQVFNAVTENFLSEASVTEDGWSVPLENLPFGSYSVYAVQTYNGLPSEKSQPVSFTVILFPPTIDHPQPGDKLARNAVIDGYARKALEFDTAQVELWLGGEFLDRVKARGVDGYWIYEHALPVGDYVLRAKQLFADKESVLSPDHAFTVIPALPIIESPIVQQHTGSRVTLSGFGYAGDWVEVAWSDAPDTLLGRAQVQANRTWSLPLSLDRPAGPQHWVVQQESEGYRSGWSEPHEVLQLSSAPTFTAPEAGHWFADTVLFAGAGETGKRIELSQWFDSRRLVSQGDSVADGTWTASPDAPLLPDAHWVKARQDDSDWGDSPRFEVAPVSSEP
ncbi:MULTISPECIES: hypothetical protein [unclassified Pseudomonas]|uniref:hypothetical protein n=1 Tax=unclassified Pseudomonas TaxID=196821 RepID=UPI0011A4B716|nr:MULTISPECIES: hypothetical protein [unclassified Pseudomonas]TWC20445.1 hypothetical protein FBY00_10471 [Pseudomonas sp. SJZ075]TWC35875.1 hypothetical protein FBY02_10472 [Pseudomonas sp. SJZ078]TWC56743.1 hypothetical protein FBY11_10471 [Pseudomonas sp. SJZ124]TWC91952.1 hypothetical protein FBY09_10471 [Pseudomonas sp. SJZ101]